jgi:hypothetical protein
MADNYQVYPAKHDPKSESDFGRNWGPDGKGNPGFLSESGEEIITDSTWEISTNKQRIPTLIISKQGSAISDSKKITSVFLKGGTVGIGYKLTNEIHTLDKFGSTRIERRTGIIFCCNT